MEDKKRYYRELKREMKRAGNKARRNHLKRSLYDNPEEAHWDEFEFRDYSTRWLNGKFRDSTRFTDEYGDGYPDEDQDRY